MLLLVLLPPLRARRLRNQWLPSSTQQELPVMHLQHRRGANQQQASR